MLLFHVDDFGLYTFALNKTYHLSVSLMGYWVFSPQCIIVILYGSGIALMLVFRVLFVWFESFGQESLNVRVRICIQIIYPHPPVYGCVSVWQNAGNIPSRRLQLGLGAASSSLCGCKEKIRRTNSSGGKGYRFWRKGYRFWWQAAFFSSDFIFLYHRPDLYYFPASAHYLGTSPLHCFI